MDILESLGTGLPHFFQEPADEKIVFTPEDFAVKADPRIRQRDLLADSQRPEK